MSFQQSHGKLGHNNERVMKEITKTLHQKLVDNQPLNCAACAAGMQTEATQESKCPRSQR